MIGAEDDLLRLDNCEACGSLDWKDCVCTPGGRREPTAQELERGRIDRLTKAEAQEANSHE